MAQLIPGDLCEVAGDVETLDTRAEIRRIRVFDVLGVQLAVMRELWIDDRPLARAMTGGER